MLGTPTATTKLKRAIVFGSTGVCGKQLVAELVHNGWRVTAVARRELDNLQETFPALHHGYEAVTPAVVDFENLDAHAAEIAGHDVAFCCLGTTHSAAGSRDAFSRVDGFYVTETARLSKLGGISTYVLMTSAGVRDWIPRWMSNYLYTKAQAERGVREQKFDHTVIVRPASIAREHTDWFVEKIGAWLVNALDPIIIARSMRLKAEECLNSTTIEEVNIIEGDSAIEEYVRRNIPANVTAQDQPVE